MFLVPTKCEAPPCTLAIENLLSLNLNILEMNLSIGSIFHV